MGANPLYGQQFPAAEIPVEQRPESLRTGGLDTWVNQYTQAKQYGLGASVYQGVAKYATDGRFSLPGQPREITAGQASEEFGLNLPDDPNTPISYAWAVSEANRKRRLANIEALNTGNPNINVAGTLSSGFAAMLTDPAEVGLNLIPLGKAAGFGAKALTKTGFGARLAKALSATAADVAGTPLEGVAKAVLSKPAQNAYENLIFSGVSTAATVQQAAQTDPEIFRGGYGWQEAAFDTATSFAAGGVIDLGVRAVGKAITSKTAARLIDPVLQKAEANTATQAGETPKIENMVDVPKAEALLKDTRAFLDNTLAEAERADVTITNPDNTKSRYNYSAEPIIPSGSLKTKTVVSGKSLVLPLPEGSRISSQFGRRQAPKKGASTFHHGLDFAVAAGSPIRASGGGKVIFSGVQKGYGNIIIVDHGNGVHTAYAHAESLAFKKGDTVRRGEVIGTVGSTGNSTGPHLHFEVRKNGKAVDPNQWLKKGAVLEEPPAARPLEPLELPENVLTRGSDVDEIVAVSRTADELRDEMFYLANKTMDDLLETSITAKELPSDITGQSIQELSERLFSIREYIGEEVDVPRIMDGFYRGAQNVETFLKAMEKLPEDRRLEVAQEYWRRFVETAENGKAVVKDSIIAEGKKLHTNIKSGRLEANETNLAKLAQFQESLAEVLPQIYAAHKVLQQVDPKFVTTELPTKVFLEAMGADVSDFGRMLLSDVPNADNMPLYRARRTMLNNLVGEASAVEQLLGEIKNKQGKVESLNPPEVNRIAQAIEQEISQKGGMEVDALMETAIEEINREFDNYFNSGLFGDTQIKSKDKVRQEIIDRINTRTFREGELAGDIETAKVTKIENHKRYTEGLEKARPIIEVCLNRGLGYGT